MAIFRLQITPIARGDKHSSVGAAAYRAGERIRDDRTNEVHNHSRRKDVTHSEILLPGHLAGQNMDWALNRASLWNTVENAESRKNSRVAREIQVTLPFELAPERRLAMARSFSQEIADHYKVAVDLAVHDPRPSGDPRNFHAHLLLTTREVSAEGLGAKTGLDMQTKERVRLGLPNTSQEFTAIRERWATITNEALKEANLEARVDHRSLAEQGIDREPKPHIPFAAYKIEQAGKYSEVAENIRADYNARVQARLEQQARQQPTPERSSEHGAASAVTSARAAAHRADNAPHADNSAPQAAPKTLEDIRREARENWLKMRVEQAAKSADQPAARSASPPAEVAETLDPPHAAADARATTTAARVAATGAHQATTPHKTPAPDDDHHP
ncbi:MAG TPA: MobQ family relaxase [Steroidobacteraceae bacterium]|nr:MobQ family relaxase [Steroidobacteraceae bacterium]